jgi:hypothetical protein
MGTRERKFSAKLSSWCTRHSLANLLPTLMGALKPISEGKWLVSSSDSNHATGRTRHNMVPCEA